VHSLISPLPTIIFQSFFDKNRFLTNAKKKEKKEILSQEPEIGPQFPFEPD